MVPITEEQRKQFVKELAEAIEAVRIKNGIKPCEHGEAEGIAVFIFYKDRWSHSTLMGKFTGEELLQAVTYAMSKEYKDIVGIPFVA